MAKNPHRFWFNRVVYDHVQEAFNDQHLSDLGNHIELYPRGRNRYPDFRVDQNWGTNPLVEVKGDTYSTSGLQKLSDKYYRSPHNIWMMGRDLALADDDRRIPGWMYRVAGICDPKKNKGADTIVYVDRGDGSHILQPYWLDDNRRLAEWPSESDLSDIEFIHANYLNAVKTVNNNIYEYLQLELPLAVTSDNLTPVQEGADDETG